MEAVIFDLDGLLADTEVISLKVYQELLRDFGIPFTEETYSRDYSGHREEENVQRFLDTYDLPWNFDQTLAKVYELEVQKLLPRFGQSSKVNHRCPKIVEHSPLPYVHCSL